MAHPNSRKTLKEYCLRELGAPVLEINVDDDQLEDRIDEAVEKWQEYHHEGVEKMYLKHKILATTLTIVEPVAEDFEIAHIITGETSGATARVMVQSDGLASEGNTIICRDALRAGEFIDGETITTEAGATATLIDPNAVTLGEIDKRYIELPPFIYGVVRILHIGGGGGYTNAGNIFDFQYQLRLHDLYDLTSTSMVYYTQVMAHLTLIDFTLNAKPMINFNRMQDRVYPLINWDGDVVPGDYVVLECYRGLDPSAYPKVWNNPWLKEYTTELFRRQWGYNLNKFNGTQLPGGVTLNGGEMIVTANANLAALKQRLIDESGPCEFFMG